MSPKISVITVCYNAVSTIETTLLSVIAQSYADIEYIVIDGASTDGTTDIIKKHAEHINFWCSEPDYGIFDAMNKGLQKATGEWVVFMNAGDSFYSQETISEISGELSNEWTMVYGDTQYIRSTGTEIEQAFEPRYILRNMPTSHQSFFIKTAIAKEIGFDTRYRYAADYNMVYQIYTKYSGKTKHVTIPVSSYEAITGLSMQHENEVYKETLDIRNFSLHVLYGYVRYYIKKMIGRR